MLWPALIHTHDTAACSDLFQGWGTLVAILVGVHVAAFLFWIIMLLVSASNNRRKATDKRD